MWSLSRIINSGRRKDGRSPWRWITPSSHPLIDHGAITFATRGRGHTITYHALVSSPASGGHGGQQQQLLPGLAQFLDHRVNGRALFPGAGFFELADAVVNFGRAGASPTGMSTNGEKHFMFVPSDTVV